MPRKRFSTSVTPTMTVMELAQHEVLDSLDRLELAVYLRLVGAWGEQKTRRVHIKNIDLSREVRGVIRALHRLEDKDLIKISYDNDKRNRTIEVL